VYEALAERDVIRSTIYSGFPAHRDRHQAGIQGTPPFNRTTVGDGAAVGLRCGVVHLVVTSTGLRSTGGSLSQRLGSVHSWLRILPRVEATRYGVTPSPAADTLTSLLRVGRGGSAGVAAGMIL
jgi:hypothetical protein